MSLKPYVHWLASFACVLLSACGASELSDEATELPDAWGEACAEDADCQDGFACNGVEVCAAGRCVAGAAPDCDDGDPCTLDGCTEGRGCVHAPKASAACSEPEPTDEEKPPLRAPLDIARPPEVECETSVDQIVITKEEDAEHYRGMHCVEGALYIEARQVDLSPLAALRRAGSVKKVGSAGDLSALTSLVRVDGNLSTASVDGLSLKALRWVGGNLESDAALAEEAAFPLLEYVGGRLSMGNPANANARNPFPVLEMIGGDLRLDEFLQVPLRSLTHVGGTLDIVEDGIALTAMGRLRSVGGSLNVIGTEIGGVLALPELQNVTGTLAIVGNPQIRSLDFTALREVGRLEIKLNPALSRCQVDALAARVVSDSESTRCCNLGCDICNGSVCALFSDPSAGQSSVLTGPLDRQLPTRAYATVVKADHLSFRETAGGPRGSLPTMALREVGTLSIFQSAYQDLTGLSQLRSVDSLAVIRNRWLTSLRGLEGVERIGRLQVYENVVLNDVSALNPSHGALEELRGDVSVYNNPELLQCKADELRAALEPIAQGAVQVSFNGPACEIE